ncbi:hypothetical protein HAX54_006067 [Datura stramonium]|uniref:Uncharacterized protein n=1 Tax=Datura stramonium TaxID=4076 RepID=A0ABS8T9N9_DATST|nr:hypothetical protein [Datura stramonium]
MFWTEKRPCEDQSPINGDVVFGERDLDQLEGPYNSALVVYFCIGNCNAKHMMVLKFSTPVWISQIKEELKVSHNMDIVSSAGGPMSKANRLEKLECTLQSEAGERLPRMVQMEKGWYKTLRAYYGSDEWNVAKSKAEELVQTILFQGYPKREASPRK